MTNWKESGGNYTYVAKYGRDDNPGTQLRPRLSIGSSTGTIAIGEGEYVEVLPQVPHLLIGNTLGGVICKVPVGSDKFVVLSNNSTNVIRNLVFIDIPFPISSGISARIEVQYCIFKNDIKYGFHNTATPVNIQYSTSLLVKQKVVSSRTTVTATRQLDRSTFHECYLSYSSSGALFGISSIFSGTILRLGFDYADFTFCFFTNDSVLTYETQSGETLVNPASLVEGQKYLVISGTLTVDGVARLVDTLFAYTSGTVSGTATIIKAYTMNEFIARFITELSLPFQFNNCAQGNVLFNNPAKMDYSLQPTSPARSMDENGQAIGFARVGSSIYASADLTGWTLTNMEWSADFGGYILTDETQDGIWQTPVLDQGAIKAFTKVSILGEAAWRNGESFDTESDLNQTPVISGPTPILPTELVADKIYYNYGYESISVTKANASVINYLAGESWTADTGDNITAVSSNNANDTVNEIIDAPNRQILEMRYSDDNLNYTAWKKFYVGLNPQIDASGYSNADPLYNSATAQNIVSRYKQFKGKIKTGNVRN